MKRLLLACWALLALSAAPALADTAGAVQPGTAATQSALQGCLYETSPAAASSGQQRAVHCDSAGNLLINGSSTPTPSPTTGGITPVVSSVAESCHVLKNAAGNLYSVSGYAGVAAWIMVFNATAAPADGAVTPTIWAYVPTAGSWSINYGAFPAAFNAGITVCASSTGPLTKTAVSTNNVFSGNIQ